MGAPCQRPLDHHAHLPQPEDAGNGARQKPGDVVHATELSGITDLPLSSDVPLPTLHLILQTLVKLATWHAPIRSNDGEEHKEPRQDLRAWCESSASISRALLMQPQETIDICMEELRKVREEGILSS